MGSLESSLNAIFNRLPPLESGNAEYYTPRYPENTSPIRRPAFMSPRTDSHRETSFLQSPQQDDENAVSIADGQCNEHLNGDVQACSASGCTDEFLDKVLDLEDNAKSSGLYLPWSNEIPQLPHKDLTSSGGSSSGKAINALEESTMTENRVVSGGSDKMGDSKSFESLMFGEAMVEHGGDQKFVELSAIFAGCNRDTQLVDAAPGREFVENADIQYLNIDLTTQKLDDHMQFVEACKDSNGSSRIFLAGSKKMLSEEQYGSRKNLQFEARVTCNNTGSSDHGIVQDSVNSISILTPADNKSMNGCRATDSDTCTGGKLSGYPNSEDEKIGPDSNECQEKDASMLISASGKRICSLDKEHQECQVIEVPQYDGGKSTPLSAPKYMVPRKRVCPRRKRKRSKNTSEAEVYKGTCKCKKTRCLQLYCACFSSGYYCGEFCSCENCFNKPEYEDTVLDFRKQIKSRNPSAFTSKTSDSPTSVAEDENRTTPSPARQRRGCNCRRSNCEKNYCDCFQAQVGCSDGCSCEDCKNTFGVKAGLPQNGAERREKTPDGKTDVIESSSSNLKPCYSNHLSLTREALNDVSNRNPTSNCTPEAVMSDLTNGSDVSNRNPSSNLTPDAVMSTLTNGTDVSNRKPTSNRMPDAVTSDLTNGIDVSNRKLTANRVPDAVTSDLTNGTGYPKTSGAHFPSSVSRPFHRSWPHENLSPQLFGSNELSYRPYTYYLLCDSMKQTLTLNNTTPTGTSMAASPYQIQASPLHFQSERLRLNLLDPQGGRRFGWRAVPHLPPPTPYRNSNGSLTQAQGAPKDGSAGHGR